jgi:hypothetical protein
MAVALAPDPNADIVLRFVVRDEAGEPAATLGGKATRRSWIEVKCRPALHRLADARDQVVQAFAPPPGGFRWAAWTMDGALELDEDAPLERLGLADKDEIVLQPIRERRIPPAAAAPPTLKEAA